MKSSTDNTAYLYFPPGASSVEEYCPDMPLSMPDLDDSDEAKDLKLEAKIPKSIKRKHSTTASKDTPNERTSSTRNQDQTVTPLITMKATQQGNAIEDNGMEDNNTILEDVDMEI